MASGRPPLPPEHHELRGTHRPDRHGDITALRPDGLPIKPPLAERASYFWDTVIGDLVRMNVAKQIDTIQLTAAAEWYARYQDCAEVLRQSTPSDEAYYKRLIQTQMCWNTCEKILVRFGLDPASRSRLRTAPAEKKQGVLSRKSAGA